MRAVVPHVLTGARVPLGAAALVAAAEGALVLSATLITIGAVTDGLDGWAARRLGTTGPFGALFDYFCDYLCFVVAPWMLTRSLLATELSIVHELLLGVPLVTAALRYAQNGLTVSSTNEELRALPGLGTVFFAFLSVASVFLDASRWFDGRAFAWTITAMTVLFSALMVAPVTYPKLSAVPGASPAVMVLLACMPFLGTRLLAAIMLVAGLLYAVGAPLLVRRTSAAPRR
jgi:phosphatidylserine synthase